MVDVACDFLAIARQLASNNNFKEAFDMYVFAFNKEPRVKKRFEKEFRIVLCRLNEELATIENKADIFANLERAIKMFPENVKILNDIGRYLYRYGYYSEALCHFEKAMSIDSSHVSIEKNLNSAKTFLFPRNQFRTLNDKIRNNAYRQAIRSSINPVTDNVLDIDAGTGLLSLYANECNPISITACESSTTLARLAQSVMDDNHAIEVVIMNKPSVILKRMDICGSSSVLLTDMIDAGLFGEYILQSLTHAWESLLCKTSTIIPGKAEYFIVGIKCDELNMKYKLSEEMKNILNISNSNVHRTTYYGETYYSEDVHLYDSVKYMCEPVSLFTIDFNNYDQVHKMLYRQEPFTADLIASEDGEINMIIGWFNLHLTNDIMLTTNPRCEGRATAWQQAVFFDVLPRKVRKNDTVNIPFLSYGGKLTTLPHMGTAVTRISPESLAFLNDSKYTNMITKSIVLACVHLGQTVQINQVDIVDTSPFPLFGVLMLKRGANSLICHAKTVDDKLFINSVLAANGIPEYKVTIIVSDYWSHDVFKDKKFHFIFSNILDLNGDIDFRRKHIVEHIKHANLNPGGILLPSSVKVMSQLISSEYLNTNNRLIDDNVDCRMAKHVNKYQVSQALNLDITRLEYEALSDVFEVAVPSDGDIMSSVIKVPITKDGICNAILCWYKLQLIDDWEDISTDRSNSFVESMAYLTNAKVFKGDEANVLRVADSNSSFKLVLDMEPY